MSTVLKKALKGNFTASRGGLFLVSLLRSKGSQNSQTVGWTSREAYVDPNGEKNIDEINTNN